MRPRDFWTLLFLLLIPTQVRADTLTGEIRGQVLDVATGRPLAGVEMILVNSSRGWEKRQLTDGFGRYLFLQLEPGNYTLRAEKESYYSSRRTDILIRLNRPKVLIPPFELRNLVSRPTRQMTLQGEQIKTAIIDLSASTATPVVLAITEEPGATSNVGLLDWALRFNFDTRTLAGLPLRGSRSFDQAALLVPGVFPAPFSAGIGPAVGIGIGSGGQFSVNGLRPRSHNFTVDGSDNNDEDIGMRRQGFVALVPQTLRSIEDFQILTAGAPAEFGRNAGAQVNAVTRSGQRDLHGTLEARFNHDRMNARDWFQTDFADRVNSGPLNGGTFQGDSSRSGSYSGVLGGAFVPEKLYFFLAGEYLHSRSREIGHFILPTELERGLRTASGFVPIDRLADFFAETRVPYSSAAGKAVFSLLPLPNHPDGPFSKSTYSQVRDSEARGFLASTKIDWYPADHSSFSARYNITDDERVIPFTGEALNSSLAPTTRTQNLALFLNTTTPDWGNALRASFGRTNLEFIQNEHTSPLLFGSSVDPESSFRTEKIETPFGNFGPFGVTGPIGRLQILPFSPVGIDVFNFPQGRTNNTYQVSDFVSHTRGDHLLKWGFDYRQSRLNSFADRNSRPLFLFVPGYISSLCSVNPSCPFATPDGLLRGTDSAALGGPSSVLQALSTQRTPDSRIGLRFGQLDLFFQDEWRIGDHFLLNLGLRYEIQGVPQERNNVIEATFGLAPEDFGRLHPADFPDHAFLIGNANQAFDRALSGWNQFLAGRDRIYRRDLDNWSPRVGFSWDPSGEGKIAIRGGYSLSYDSVLGAVTSQSRNVFPTFVPANFDLNFQLPDGRFLNNPSFFLFDPTEQPLVTPGTLNRYNLGQEAFATALGSLFIQSPPFTGAGLSSNGLAFTLPERDLQAPSAQHLVLSGEYHWRSHYLVALRYVGTRGRHLTRFTTPNAGLIASPVLFSSPLLSPLLLADLPPSLGESGLARPDTRLGSYRVFRNDASSEYHSLQLSLERHFSEGLQFQSHWTWSHALDEVSDPFPGRGFSELPQNITRPDLEWGPANFDIRHRVTGHLLWQIPRGSSWIGRNWTLSLIGVIQSGQPFTVISAFDRNLDGNLTDRLDRRDGIFASPVEGRYLDFEEGVEKLSLLAARGEDGRIARNSFRLDGLANLDLALSRRVPLADERALHLRVEVFNLWNSTSFGTPVRYLESPGFGRSYDTQTDPRRLRLMLRLEF